MLISINGKLVDEAEASLPLTDRGYLFGEGLFETMRAYQGAIPFLDKHLGRLEWSASFIGIPFLHPSEIKQSLEEVLKANKIREARLKIILSGKNEKGYAPLLPTDDMGINVVILCEPFKPYAAADYEKGVDLAVVHSIHNDPPPASTIKSVSWLTKLIARREYAEKSCFDGILLSADGKVTETTTANIFWVDRGTLCTTPLSKGLLGGITREVVLGLARENGIQVAERVIDPATLKVMEEVFLTSSLMEIMPVSRIDGHYVTSGKPGKITKELTELYRKRVAEELEP